MAAEWTWQEETTRVVFVSGPLCSACLLDDKAEKGEEKDPAVMTQSEETAAEEDLLGPNCYYDKSKSFFDNISSELKTRSGPGCTVEKVAVFSALEARD